MRPRHHPNVRERLDAPSAPPPPSRVLLEMDRLLQIEAQAEMRMVRPAAILRAAAALASGSAPRLPVLTARSDCPCCSGRRWRR